MSEVICMRCRRVNGHDIRCDRFAWSILVVRARSRDGMEKDRRKVVALDEGRR